MSRRRRRSLPTAGDDICGVRRRGCDPILGDLEGGPTSLEWLAAAARDRCCYCGCETWLPRHRRRTARMLPIRASTGAPRGWIWRMATREHLVRRADGGSDRASNLALACLWCNSTRGAEEATIWAIVVAAIVRVGRHPCARQ